jgi:GGDEF domain-containing protein
MKRICNLDGQITSGRCFAIYCTVIDRFESVNDSWTWETADELAESFDGEIAAAFDLRDYWTEFKERCVGLARGSGY